MLNIKFLQKNVFQGCEITKKNDIFATLLVKNFLHVNIRRKAIFHKKLFLKNI